MITSPSGKSYIGRSLNLEERLISIHGEFIKEWYSLTEASESLNISRSSIYQSCRKGYIAHGYKWKYNN